MSALGLDDRHDAAGIMSYAPRRSRRGDGESTIRPVLERLSRGEGREPGPRLVQRAVVHHLPPDVEAVAKSSVPMIARLTIAAGILAAAAAGVVVFVPHGASNAVPPDAAVPAVSAAAKSDSALPAATAADAAPAGALPKAVQTLAIRKVDDATAAPAAVLNEDARMPATSTWTANVDPVAAPLTLWTMMPANAPSDSLPVAATTDEAPSPPAAAKSETKAPSHKAVVRHHARHVVRHGRHHPRHVAQTAPTPPVETEPAQPQPVKKLPLQAAIDRLFAGSSATTTPSPQR